MDEKMRMNVEDDSDPALISKKFWKHAKSTSNSTRIPETVWYKNKFRNKPIDQANLFNDLFFEQFPEESNYGGVPAQKKPSPTLVFRFLG